MDFRLVSATNRNIKSMVEAGTFREDLYYRISDIQLRVPALRERLDDVAMLARHFATPKQLADDALGLLESVGEWPGNVRQLKKIVENACKMAPGYVISKEAIVKQLQYQQLPAVSGSESIDRSTDMKSERAELAELVPKDLSYFGLRKRWQDGDLDSEERGDPKAPRRKAGARITFQMISLRCPSSSHP